jgi:murein DD-endopeptidase MepM/ murein hydrolase activator NlpD
MLKLVRFGLVVAVLLSALLAGTVTAQSVEDVEAMVAELAESDYYSPEVCMRYLEYKQQRVEVVSYTVVKGDTLIGIAQKYGVSLATISESNQIENPNLIRVGQQLQFPAVTGLLYVVAQDDELSTLAEKYEVDYQTIWFANALDSRELTPGALLVIPGAKMPNPLLRAKPVSRRGSQENSGFIWPLLGRISSVYGMRNGTMHRGVDITGRTGTPIFAVASGTVISSGWAGSYGYMVKLQHKSGIKTLYAHASRLKVAKGDSVNQGDVIAYVGSTGYSTGPHLHFEVIVNGSNVNPISRLP